MTQEAFNSGRPNFNGEPIFDDQPKFDGQPIFDGHMVCLADGRRVSLERLLWDARQRQSREAGRLCGILARRLWRTLAALFGPPFGWQRRQLAGGAGGIGAALSHTEQPRTWFDPRLITDTAGYRSDNALGRPAPQPDAVAVPQAADGERSAA